MKKITLILVLVVSFAVVSPPKTSAIFCGNCSQLVKQLLEMQQDIKNYGQYIKTAKSAFDTVQKLTNTNPLTAGFGKQTAAQLKLQTRRWLMGGAEGNPLIVLNPEAYVENSKTNELRRQIKLLESAQQEAQNASNEGIISYLIRDRRNTLGLKKGVLSPAPADKTASITQTNLCENGGIESLAEQENGPENLNDPNDRTRARINELRGTLCSEDPNQNPELNNQLLAISKSDSFFSWDNWLCLTGGECNPFVLREQTIKNVNEQVKAAEEEAKKKSEKGVLPKEKCVEEMPELLAGDEEGDVPEEEGDNCISSIVEKTAEEVSDANLSANGIGTAFDEIIASMANEKSGIEDVLNGLGVGELFSSVSDILGTMSELGQAIGQVGGAATDLGNSLNPNSPSINLLGLTNTVYVNRSTSQTPPDTSDGSTQQERDEISAPFKDSLIEHQGSMRSLQTELGRVTSLVDAYTGFVSGVTTCTQNIQNNQNYSQSQDGGQITNFTNRARARKAIVLDPFVNKTTTYRTKLPTTNTYLSTTLTSLAAARSIATISGLLQNYQRAVSSGTILPRESPSLVDAFVGESTPVLEEDMGISSNPEASPTTDTIKVVLDECNTYLQEVINRTPPGTN